MRRYAPRVGIRFGWFRGARAVYLLIIVAVAAAAGLLAVLVGVRPSPTASSPASSAPSPVSTAAGGYQRGPDPTPGSVSARRGPFATASVSVAPGNGFHGGTVYYPIGTGQGSWAAVAIVPGYTALFAEEEAWMGPWLASFGFVVIGVETNSRTDREAARADALLAALDYLTRQSPVRDRVDPDRLGVIGHSSGGGGVIRASQRRPTLRAAVTLAPYSPSQDFSGDQVPTMVMGGQDDTVVAPADVDRLYATMPATTPSDFVQLAGAGHASFTRDNVTEMRLLIPWLKMFLDGDTRYAQFLCPLTDTSGISRYQDRCPYTPTVAATPRAPRQG
jgi:pimeloyl-ACP methyl ester carboxylesterase